MTSAPASHAEQPAASSSPQSGGGAPRGRLAGFSRWVLAAAGYVLAAVIIWWHVWTGHPRSTMPCECGDPSSFAWYMGWAEYAIQHGQNLLYTTRMHYPGGMNLLDNTSVLALGTALAPVTWLFGPIASLNVALTAAPALTGLSACLVLRRGLRLGWPAAFLGGLLFGFSPFVLHQDAVSHLQLTFMALLPLIFWGCYELTVSQRGRWWAFGLLAGLSAALQFFVGTELLTVAALTIVMTLAVTVVAVLWRDRDDLRHGELARRLPFAAKGFGLAIAVAGLLLAYPFYYAVAGPGHIAGADWAKPSENSLLRMLLPLKLSNYDQHHLAAVGYLGVPGALPGYIGLAALAVLLVAALVVLRPLPRLCAIMTVICLWLSLGAYPQPLSGGGEPSWLPLPWQLVSGLPVLNKLAPANFSVPALWFTIVAGAVLIDLLLPGRAAVAAAAGSLRVALAGRAWAVAAAVATAAALVLPWLLAWPLPYVTQRTSVSAWASQAGKQLPPSSVVLFVPYPATRLDSALVWQAATGMPYSVVGGRGIVTGPGGVATHGLAPGTPEAMLGTLLTSAAPRKLPDSPASGDVIAFREALRRWGVTEVVLSPDVRGAGYARIWFGAVLRSAPVRQDGAWVWTRVQSLVK